MNWSFFFIQVLQDARVIKVISQDPRTSISHRTSTEGDLARRGPVL